MPHKGRQHATHIGVQPGLPQGQAPHVPNAAMSSFFQGLPSNPSRCRRRKTGSRPTRGSRRWAAFTQGDQGGVTGGGVVRLAHE